jgi:hypothetical protein
MVRLGMSHYPTRRACAFENSRSRSTRSRCSASSRSAPIHTPRASLSRPSIRCSRTHYAIRQWLRNRAAPRSNRRPRKRGTRRQILRQCRTPADALGSLDSSSFAYSRVSVGRAPSGAPPLGLFPQNACRNNCVVDERVLRAADARRSARFPAFSNQCIYATGCNVADRGVRPPAYET